MRSPADGYSGLFHFALLVPTRADLARWLAHAARDRVALTGLSDHDVSEAIYLRDPDYHGIEIYADRPRETWEGKVGAADDDDAARHRRPRSRRSTTGSRSRGSPAGTAMGHVHFCVADIPSTVGFYRDALGFELMAQLGDQAAFLATGGYHHHVGANTWQSRGAPYAPGRPRAADRARRSTGAAEDAGASCDPSGIPLTLSSATAR